MFKKIFVHVMVVCLFLVFMAPNCHKEFTVKKGLPDLIVKDLELIEGCKIKVTIANIGTAGVPPAGYEVRTGPAVQMYRNNLPWGGIALKGFDPARKLTAPNSSVSWIWFPRAENLNLTPGTHTIRIVLDNNKVVESNEKNNNRTEQLTCRK